MTNLAHSYVLHLGKCVPGCREEFDGCCIDFAGDLLDCIGHGRIGYVDLPWPHKWRYHAFVVVDEVVHDLWEEEAIPLADYLERIGAESVEYPAEEVEA